MRMTTVGRGRVWTGVGRLLAAAALTLAPGGALAQEAAARATAEVVRAREIAFAQSMADRDLDAFAAFVSAEAIFYNGDGTVLRGREAVVAGWRPFFEGTEAPFSWGPDSVEALASGRLAFSTGPVHSPEGQVFGRFNSVWRLEDDGVWRVVFDRGSPPE